MPKYNTNFELSIDDLAQIEDSIRVRQAQLCAQRREAEPEAQGEIEAAMRSGEELLGRLHQQKVFYRPRDYISG